MSSADPNNLAQTVLSNNTLQTSHASAFTKITKTDINGRTVTLLSTIKQSIDTTPKIIKQRVTFITRPPPIIVDFTNSKQTSIAQSDLTIPSSPRPASPAKPTNPRPASPTKLTNPTKTSSPTKLINPIKTTDPTKPTSQLVKDLLSNQDIAALSSPLVLSSPPVLISQSGQINQPTILPNSTTLLPNPTTQTTEPTTQLTTQATELIIPPPNPTTQLITQPTMPTLLRRYNVSRGKRSLASFCPNVIKTPYDTINFNHTLQIIQFIDDQQRLHRTIAYSDVHFISAEKFAVTYNSIPNKIIIYIHTTYRIFVTTIHNHELEYVFQNFANIKKKKIASS